MCVSALEVQTAMKSLVAETSSSGRLCRRMVSIDIHGRRWHWALNRVCCHPHRDTAMIGPRASYRSADSNASCSSIAISEASEGKVTAGERLEVNFCAKQRWRGSHAFARDCQPLTYKYHLRYLEVLKLHLTLWQSMGRESTTFLSRPRNRDVEMTSSIS